MKLKTKGVSNESGTLKDYKVWDVDSLQEIYCEREENGKTYSTVVGHQLWTGQTLKQCKARLVQFIEHGDCESGQGSGLGVEHEVEDVGARGLWDGCEPCAIIIELLAIIPQGSLEGPDGQRLQQTINHTLDNFGYLNEDGGHDVGRSRSEMDRWMSRGH